MSIDWSVQHYAQHAKLIHDIVKQIEKEWREFPWWKRAWITITRKSRKWKHDQLIERYRAETKIEEWGEANCPPF